MISHNPKIAVVVTHPVQHFCPMYKSWSEETDWSLKVIFGYKKTIRYRLPNRKRHRYVIRIRIFILLQWCTMILLSIISLLEFPNLFEKNFTLNKLTWKFALLSFKIRILSRNFQLIGIFIKTCRV